MLGPPLQALLFPGQLPSRLKASMRKKERKGRRDGKGKKQSQPERIAKGCGFYWRCGGDVEATITSHITYEPNSPNTLLGYLYSFSFSTGTMSSLFFTPSHSAGLFCWQMDNAGDRVSQTAFLCMVLSSSHPKVKWSGPTETLVKQQPSSWAGHHEEWGEAGRHRGAVCSWFVLILPCTLSTSPWSYGPAVTPSPVLNA